MSDPAPKKDAAAIRQWLVGQFARRMKMSPDKIDPRAPVTGFALDSLEAVAIVGEMEEWLDRRLEPTLLWRFPTIEALSEHLSKDGA